MIGALSLTSSTMIVTNAREFEEGVPSVKKIIRDEIISLFMIPKGRLIFHIFLRRFIHLSVHRSTIHPFIYPFIHPFIHPSIHSSIHLSIYTSIHFHVYQSYIHSNHHVVREFQNRINQHNLLSCA